MFLLEGKYCLAQTAGMEARREDSVPLNISSFDAKKKAIRLGSESPHVGAGNGSRTRDIDLGKVALYH